MKFILSFFFFLFLFGYIFRLLAPYLMKWWIRKLQKKFTQQNGTYSQQQQRAKKEGQVSVEQSDNLKEKKVDKDVGDYVDYEDVKSH